MDIRVPGPEDHTQTLIFVRLCSHGSASGFDFSRVLERLRRIDVLTVSESPLRLIYPRFITVYDEEKAMWSEFQAHRRIVGLLCVGYGNETAVPSVALEPFLEQYSKYKNDFKQTLVDTRCLLFGFESKPNGCPEQELLLYDSMEDSEMLECDVREYLKSIFWVLESRRLDLSFEKVDSPPCPLVAQEEKYRVGVENKTSKIYRRKCIGRLRKQIADYTLMTGLPTLALETYSAAIDMLKSSNDWLWLAGAYEGWACAAIVAKYVKTKRRPSLQRVPTFTSGQLKELQQQRMLTDERRGSDSSPATQMIRLSLSSQDIIEKFRMALENYEKFSFAATIEYEAVVKASAVFRYERQFFETEVFLREHSGKYLDDNFTNFNHEQKAIVCLTSANIFRQIGFQRKSAFFLRLAALFRLRTASGMTANELEYRQVYPLLYNALRGCHVPESVKDVPLGPEKGWPTVMLRAVHEVFLTALQGGYREAAIRHACYMLQAFLEDVDDGFVKQLCAELQQLNDLNGEIHNAHTHLQLPSGIILPPLPMNKFPVVLTFKVLPLLGSLEPEIVKKIVEKDIFIYTPFKKVEKRIIRWVVGCSCGVALAVRNLLPFELKVSNLIMQTEGVEFDSMPIELNLPPGPCEPVPVKLVGIPRASGRLVIVGYSCEVLSVRNVCRLRDVPWLSTCHSDNQPSSVEVDVIPSLPFIELKSSLPRAVVSESDKSGDTSAEVTVYSGQTFEHCIKIQNVSETESVGKIELSIHQPSVSGGPRMIELDEESSAPIEPLGPLDVREIRFRIFGLDPLCTSDDEPPASERSLDIAGANTAPSSSRDSSSKSASLMYGERIPYTGRLLTATFKFRYDGVVTSPEGDKFRRTAKFTLCVTVVPAVTVADWAVLPGDGPMTRYLVLDVTNSTDAEAELGYCEKKQMNVQSKEVCRVPLLCPCCDAISSSAFSSDAERRSLLVVMEETERLRKTLEKHVAKHLNIKWTIPSMDLEGLVPVGPLLASIKLLRQLVLPPLSIGVTVNGSLAQGQDEPTFAVGEMIHLQVELSSSVARQFSGLLWLNCYQDLQNNLPALDRSDHLLFAGPVKQPFALNQSSLIFKCDFRFLFCYEGSYKVKPDCKLVEKSSDLNDYDCDLFIPVISFNIVTKST